MCVCVCVSTHHQPAVILVIVFMTDVDSTMIQPLKNLLDKIALGELHNGAILSVDIRQRPDSHARLTGPRILLHSKSSSQDTKKSRFELRGSIYPSGTTSTSSSISCLTSLEQYDQYFLASSMDGSTKLYDHRMVQRGAVLSYDGNVGLHYAIWHAVDPSENCHVRWTRRKSATLECSSLENYYLRRCLWDLCPCNIVGVKKQTIVEGYWGTYIISTLTLEKPGLEQKTVSTL